MVKLWRIHCIVNTVGIKRVKITETQQFTIILQYLLLLLIALAIVQILNDSRVGFIVTTSRNQSTYQPICSNLNSYAAYIVLTFIYATEGISIIMAAHYLWLTRNVPTIVNETAVVGPLLSFSVAVIVILTSVTLSLNIDAIIMEYFVSSGFIIVIFGSSIYYTMQKYLVLEKELNKPSHEKKNKEKKPKRVVNGRMSPASEISTQDDVYSDMLTLLRREKTTADKEVLIHKQITLLKQLLMRLEEDDGVGATTKSPNSLAPIQEIDRFVSNHEVSQVNEQL